MNSKIKQAEAIDGAFSQLAAAAVFGGVALADYETAISDAKDADALVSQRQADVISAQADRDAKITILSNKTKLVVNGVKGDVLYGDDSALYGAMGFVRSSQRASGLSRPIRRQFANAAARDNATPTAINEIVLQTDTNVLYQGTATTAGAWIVKP